MSDELQLGNCFFCKWKEAAKWFAAMLEYSLINYRVHVILKHPPIISRKTLHNTLMGFLTGVENMRGLYPPSHPPCYYGGGGALQNLIGGLKSIHGKSMGGL